jgi:hypothetical protein
MIFASTLVLALAISSVPAAVGAPIGNRNFDVRATRRSTESGNAPVAARAVAAVPEHHSARSYVAGGGNDPRASDAGTADINKREVEPQSTGNWRRERAKDNIPRHVRDAIPKKRAAEATVEARHPHGGPHPHGGKGHGQNGDNGSGEPEPEPTPESREVKVEARHPHGGPHHGGKGHGQNGDNGSGEPEPEPTPESREVKVETRHPHGGPPHHGGKGHGQNGDNGSGEPEPEPTPESREVKVEARRVRLFGEGKPTPQPNDDTNGRRELQGESHEQHRRGPLGAIANFKRAIESLD